MSDVKQDVKQVIVIRRDLRMRRGKEVAQGAHAAVAFLASRMTREEPSFSRAEYSWLYGGMRKICVTVSSEEELLAVAAKAAEADLTCEVIADAGLTEFGGVATLTALAIGPDYDEKIDPVTGDLKLY